jgi:FtsP/CotA-like multicopper oxidase with cupredoxin domain
MNSNKVSDSFSRRQVLKLAAYGAMGFAAGGLWPFPTRSAADQARSDAQETDFHPDLDISLMAGAAELPIFPGEPTRVWQYRSVIHKGEKSRLVELPNSYLGPVIRAHQGEKVRVRFTNSIPEHSIVHWHGLHVPSIMDGHPRHVVSQGESYLYEFEVKNRAGTYWYHPHPHGRTGPQVYRGLAGLFIVSDDEERSMGLPSGECDVPLVIQDRFFDRDNQLVYLAGDRMAQMIGFLGDTIMVNGMPDFRLIVSTHAYRLRLLNGSNSRIYRLAWEDGRPLTIIGTDGGLLAMPVQRRYAFLGPGERLEIWADFSGDPVGFETALVSLPFGIENTGRGMMGRQGFPGSAGFPIFTVNVARREQDNRPLPQELSEIRPAQPRAADNSLNPRRFFLTMNHMQWSINGRTFEMEDVAGDEIVRLGSREIWEFYNTGGGMMHMMNVPHPIHLHGKQFRVIERSGVRHQGYVDEGWKDTVLLMPGERIRILVDFEDFPGMFLYHCHNLEHEDMGMMRNYYIES